ncbi:MAG TPA: terminase family protein [Bryobacteraceae bacterium]|nr:terminase family protein [Bryobacteraceae bacterium]
MSTPTIAQLLDPCSFAEAMLGFTPDPHQERVLQSTANQVILNCSRQWGKSTVCAAKAVYLAYSQPNAMILVASPSARQSGEFVRKASHYLRQLRIKPRGDGDNEISLLLPNHSRIVGIPGVEATVRGFSSVSLLLIDEAARVSDELYYALRPMLAVGGGSLWVLSTPYGKRGFFYHEWTNGGNDWERFQVPATECPRITERFLEGERRSLGPRYFAQEYLCEFHATNDALFTEQQVRQAIVPDIDPLFTKAPPSTAPGWLSHNAITSILSRQYFIGVDLGQRRDRTTIVIIEVADIASSQRNAVTYAPDRRTRRAVRYMERLPLDTPYTAIVERVTRLANELAASNPCTVVVDATGVGLPVVDSLRMPTARWRLMPVTIGHSDRDTYVDGFWRVAKRDLIARLQIAFDFEELTICSALPETETMVEELTAMRASLRASGHTRYESPGEARDDLAIALSLAWWAADARRAGQIGEDKRLL